MALSGDLISQFVKVTNDTKKTKTERIVYGTAKEYDGKKYVQLDGSELLTPISTTADIKDGERVTVMIKNHSATVTGNVSSPSASSKDVGTIGQNVTRVETLVADTVTVKELDVERARINDLEADVVTISGLLSAGDANIGNLVADNATIKQQLTAQAADILDLKTGVADIDTLIFGSATGNVIQTSFSNAVIAQVGDAQIKSAMIESIAASKITSGDILTNNVHVKSQNGLLLISDDTIQIKDGTRTRVQIGKDASNDYSINVWDVNGNLMFSKGGITDSAIKSAIIRDDMVSDTANIAAHKLDIDSLFEEINGGTNTIKSTKVKLDESNQTLDVAFKSLSNTVTSQGQTITSQGTAISTIQGQITSKIWQQDINAATGSMTTQYSTLSQDLSGFKTTVGNTYATKSALSSVEQTAAGLTVSVQNAAKTASNYLNFSGGGLIVGNHTVSTLGKNVLIDSEAIKLRTGTTVNAVFGADIIELAKGNDSATISMLNGTFKIYYDADTSEAGLGIYGITSTGEERLAFQPVNENDNLTLGWGGYNAKKNGTNIYGHNIKLIAGNDIAIECDDWQINIDGNLFAKATTGSFVELIGLSSDNNTAIGHGGYTAALGKTHIYGNKIQHIVNTKSGSASYKPYYEAGDSFETEWYGAGFISSSSKVVYFSIPLAKPIVGSTTPNVTVTNATTGKGGLQVRQDANYVFGSSSTDKATPSSYSAKVMGDGNFVQIEATMANTTNAVNNAPCGINANIKITFS